MTDIVSQIRELIVIAREYILGLSIELERKRITGAEPQNVKRQLELTAYFTHVRLQPAHQVLTLRQAMGNFSRARNYTSAAKFATRVQELTQDEKALASVSGFGKWSYAQLTLCAQARQALALSDRNPTNAIEIDYDGFSEFTVCPGSLTPIYAGQPSVEDPYTGAKYKPEFKGKLCKITQVTEVGKVGSGLKLSA